MNKYGNARAQPIDVKERTSNISRFRFSVAPMMEWTDRHCRFFHRLLTRRALLYTEMVTTGAVLHGDRAQLIGFDPFEHPLALQLGGSDPGALAQCARIAEDLGYDEINLNVGCPSDRVQEGRFGACLMAEPDHVGECVAAMKAQVRVPITVRCHIGIDEQDPEEALEAYRPLALDRAKVDGLVVHARKAWLKGLSPRQNRDVPPLDYGRVHRLKAAHPGLAVVLNGGIGSLAEAISHLDRVDGVMMGRAAYQEPWRPARGRPALVRRCRALERAEGGRAGAHPVYRTRAGAWHATLRHHAPHAGPVPRRARSARFPTSLGDRSGEARRWGAGAGGSAGSGRRPQL